MPFSQAAATLTVSHAAWLLPWPALQVVAFVKGTRQAPQCGFSYKMLTLLNDSRAEYEVSCAPLEMGRVRASSMLMQQRYFAPCAHTPAPPGPRTPAAPCASGTSLDIPLHPLHPCRWSMFWTSSTTPACVMPSRLTVPGRPSRSCMSRANSWAAATFASRWQGPASCRSSCDRPKPPTLPRVMV